MTRDETIEKVARAICRVQHNGCGAEACDGIFNLDDCCSGHIKFWEAAEAAVAAMRTATQRNDYWEGQGNVTE